MTSPASAGSRKARFGGPFSWAKRFDPAMTTGRPNALIRRITSPKASTPISQPSSTSTQTLAKVDGAAIKQPPIGRCCDLCDINYVAITQQDTNSEFRDSLIRSTSQPACGAPPSARLTSIGVNPELHANTGIHTCDSFSLPRVAHQPGHKPTECPKQAHALQEF